MAEVLQNIAIIGGGTAGWIAAAMLKRGLGDSVAIRLVESEEIGTVGVGEATIPTMLALNQFLRIDENEMLKRTQGTIKLGIEFRDWYKRDHAYTHMFGTFGYNLGILPFYQYWLKRHLDGAPNAGSLWDYCFNQQAARQNRFTRVDRIPDSPLEGLVHAYQFDAILYARFLRAICESSGVVRTEGRVTGVNLRPDDGFIESVTLQSGEIVAADMFIDCSGFRGLLIEDALHAGYDDWTKWLPCDRAVAVPCKSVMPLTPVTRSTAHDAGWQWRIPLQHRIGNGHVFSSAFTSVEAATDTLMANLDGEALADPRVLSFVTGRRKTSWVKNCLSLGLAAGFMEPLESTSIHLAQSGVTRFLTLFPDKRFNPLEIAEYNRRTQREYELIRDFIILHYKATQRDDSPFWNYVRTMDIPDSLAHKIALFQEHGRVLIEPDDLFKEMSWVQVLLGQGIMPRAASPLTRVLNDAQIDEVMANLKTIINRAAGSLPDHAAFLNRFAKAAA